MTEKFKKFLEDHLVLEEFLKGLESVGLTLERFCDSHWPVQYISHSPSLNTKISIETWHALDDEWMRIVNSRNGL
jgi:hypothetical protein